MSLVHKLGFSIFESDSSSFACRSPVRLPTCLLRTTMRQLSYECTVTFLRTNSLIYFPVDLSLAIKGSLANLLDENNDEAVLCYEYGAFLLQLLLVPRPVFLCASTCAPKQEVTLSLGGVFSQSSSLQATGTAQISSDFDLEANYGYRFLHANIAALYGEIAFVALPKPKRDFGNGNRT